MDLSSLTARLKNKKELKDLDESFIETRINEYLNKNKVDLKNEKSKSYRIMFKFLRKKLRETYGMFRVIKEERNLSFYKKYFNEFSPKIIMDLGCGLEPLRYSEIYKAKYFCFDINKNEISKINNFFNDNKIKRKAEIFNLVDNDLNDLPKSDLCLILKVLESLESVKKNFSKELLKNIKSKVIIASFAKIVLGKKERIKKSGRSWFRRMLRDLNYNYEIEDFDDEIVFIIKKL